MGFTNSAILQMVATNNALKNGNEMVMGGLLLLPGFCIGLYCAPALTLLATASCAAVRVLSDNKETCLDIWNAAHEFIDDMQLRGGNEIER
jgi:hypothetical protein